MNRMRKLAIITSHPIQYNAPLFELITRRNKIGVKVFYTWGESVLKDKYDPGFGKVIEWDIPLLKGYDYEFLENTSTDKGSHHFSGIINPDAIQQINAYAPDSVLVYGWAFKSHLNILRYYKGKIPVLFRGDSTLLDKAGFLASLKRTIFLRWIYRYVDYALYTGKSNCAYYKKAGLKEKQLVFSPHAIDNARFTCASAECKSAASVLRSKLNIQQNEILFLFAGKIEAKKDPIGLAEAFMNAGFSNNAHLLFVGNGELESALKASCSSSANIHFLDFQNQSAMPYVYEASNVFVLPSKGPGETWGLAVNEAMANGKPVIVSDKCGCAADLVKQGENGYVFEAGNIAMLAGFLKKIAEANLTKMGSSSIEIINEYTIERNALAVESIVNRN